MPRPDHHNEIELNLLQTGSLTYLLGGRKVTIEAGRLAAFWAAIPHQVLGADNNPEYFVATIPLVWFLQWKLPDRLVRPVLHGQVICGPVRADAAEDGGRFARWTDELATGPSELRRAALLEIEARLVRLAQTLPAVDAETATDVMLSRGGLSKAEQMAAYIAQHYTERMTVEEVSRSVRLHPNYAMAVFQRAFGGTIVEFVTQHRMSHAQRLLVTTDDAILNIALDAGFGSLSRFNEVFKTSCGCTPRIPQSARVGVVSGKSPNRRAVRETDLAPQVSLRGSL